VLLLSVMIILILIVLGLCLGSFVNATVWRLHEQALGASKKKSKYSKKQLSISKGRSMCVHCGHELAAKDLIPLFSWLWLRGKCRYCHKKIDDEPLVELAMPLLFVASYIWWPVAWSAAQYLNLAAWLVAVVVLMALLVYDIRWMLLPNKLVYPLIVGAAALVLVNAVFFDGGTHLLWYSAISAAIAGGIFCLLFYISDGKWIGGGDVKLGFALGLLLMDPYNAFLMIFGASLLGTIFSVPALMGKKLTSTSRIPFGPFLIIATLVVRLFGASFVAWYRRRFLSF
jgi:prepilin signal peptidase PulO-like enzyme (type II secretory pathway)